MKNTMEFTADERITLIYSLLVGATCSAQDAEAIAKTGADSTEISALSQKCTALVTRVKNELYDLRQEGEPL